MNIKSAFSIISLQKSFQVSSKHSVRNDIIPK